MVEIAAIWQELLGNRPTKNIDRTKLYEEKEKILNSLPSPITKGEKKAKLTREQAEDLLAPARASLNAGMYIRLVRFLYRGLAKGKKSLSWDVSIPSIPTSLPREPARFSPHKFKELHKLRRLEAVFINSLTSAQDLNPKQRLGQLFFSAIMYGGLLDRQWLEPWLEAFSDRVVVHGNDLWFDMQRTWQYERESDDGSSGSKKRSAEKSIIIARRWIADPLTKCLVVHWKSLPEQKRKLSVSHPGAYNLVKEFLSHAGSLKEDIPESFSKLIKMVETRLSLVVPPFLASYAAGSVKAVSLAPEVWARLYSGKLVPRQSEIQSDEEQIVATKRRTNDNCTIPSPLSEQEQLLKKMRSIFSSKAGVKKGNAGIKRELDSFVDTYGQEICPLLNYLVSWANRYVAQESRYSPATPERYLCSIGRILLLVFGNEDLMAMECGDFIERYDRAIELVKKDKEKITARQNLGRFHDHLVRKFGMPRINQGFFYGKSGPPETTVDANLLSQAEFDRLKLALGWDDKKRPDNATAALLAAILGFRCGLRRNEVLFIRVRDIHGGHKPELVLRATAKRSLKTPSSTRRLPLYVLLPADELDFFRSWLCRFSDKIPGALVFSLPENPLQAFADAAVFGPIHEALVMITGDNSLRFHHLRHSFAIWLLVRLTANGLRTAAKFLDHPEFDDSRVTELRISILGNEDLGRKGAYAVALLCGHADLETTFTSYIHLCDWLLGHALKRPGALPRLSEELLSGATGLSRATVYRAMKDREIPDRVWDQLFQSAFKRVGGLKDPQLEHAYEPVAMRINFRVTPLSIQIWKTVQQALRMHQIDRVPIENISMVLDMDTEKIQCWIDETRRIATMKVRVGINGKYNFRHIELSKNISECTTETSEVKKKNRRKTNAEVFPSPLVYKADRDLAQVIFTTFEKLSENDRQNVLDQVDYFIEKFSCQAGMMYFWEVDKARSYVDAVRLLGIKADRIQLVDGRGNPSTEEATTRRRAYWEDNLGFGYGKWKSGNKRRGRVDGYGTIGIQVVNYKDSKARSSYGFRYTIYMLAIAYWD